MPDRHPPKTDRPAGTLCRRRFGLALSAMLLTGGCKLFNNGWSHTFGDKKPDGEKNGGLPQVQRLAETVGMEIVFLERPADEPLLQPKKLWEGVDLVGQVPPDLRQRLRKHGFQIGHSGATPNSALETLLGLKSASSGAQAPIDPQKMFGHRVIRPTGGETVVPASKFHPQIVGLVTDETGRPIDFENARCVFRITAERLQDGWAKLEFTPEIHHGRETYRAMANENSNGFVGTTSQRIYRLYNLRFSMKLNVGEMAVITSEQKHPDSLAGSFFVEGLGNSAVQRLLIVRIADVATTPAIHAPLR